MKWWWQKEEYWKYPIEWDIERDRKIGDIQDFDKIWAHQRKKSQMTREEAISAVASNNYPIPAAEGLVKRLGLLKFEEKEKEKPTPYLILLRHLTGVNYNTKMIEKYNDDLLKYGYKIVDTNTHNIVDKRKPGISSVVSSPQPTDKRAVIEKILKAYVTREIYCDDAVARILGILELTL